MIEVHVFPSGPLETNCYLVIEQETGQSFLIDPGPGSFFQVQEYLHQHSLMLEALALTHSHWDHTMDAHLFLKEYPFLGVFVHPLDMPNLFHPGSDGVPQIQSVPALSENRVFSYGEQFIVGNTAWSVLHTLGHTPGCVCLFQKEQKLVFTGDTLFCGTYGAVHFPTSSRRDMFQSLKVLLGLPGDTVMYPGHGESSALEVQKKWMQKVVEAKAYTKSEK